jgi:DNA-binding MarR family transcriptional regulator
VSERTDVEETVAVLRLLTEVTDRTMAVVGEVLAEFDLTASAGGVLWALDPRGEPPTMRSLAARLHCDPSTISLTAEKLVAAGLVERRPHPTDGRKRVLALTDRGLELWETLSRRLHETSRLSTLTPEERRTLVTLLTRTRPRQP